MTFPGLHWLEGGALRLVTSDWRRASDLSAEATLLPVRSHFARQAVRVGMPSSPAWCLLFAPRSIDPAIPLRAE